jgi:hypothetical protein
LKSFDCKEQSQEATLETPSQKLCLVIIMKSRAVEASEMIMIMVMVMMMMMICLVDDNEDKGKTRDKRRPNGRSQENFSLQIHHQNTLH